VNTAENIINIPITRLCTKCKVEKSFGNFYNRNKQRYDGEINTQCKECVKEFNRINKAKRLAENPEYWKAKWLVSKQKSIVKKVGHYKNAEKDYQYRRKYGITLEDARKMLIAQMGMCANRACGKELSVDNSSIKVIDGVKRDEVGCVDHNHETGKVRAILCGRCNMAVGVIENKNIMFGLTEYLQKHEEE
jgi:hypothetical protein